MVHYVDFIVQSLSVTADGVGTAGGRKVETGVGDREAGTRKRGGCLIGLMQLHWHWPYARWMIGL